jgi:hypothetical protein
MQYKGTKLNAYRYLTDVPKARERVNKYKTVTNLIQNMNPIAKAIDKAELVRIVYYAIKYDRDIRHVKQKHKELRGTDWSSKKKYERKALLEYGYNAK